jgi:transcriptional regulator with XRE-family HTH domain
VRGIALENLPAVRSFLRERRRARGLSQRDLAKKAGLSQPTIAYMEGHERSMGVSYLDAWAATLGLEARIVFYDRQTGREVNV